MIVIPRAIYKGLVAFLMLFTDLPVPLLQAYVLPFSNFRVSFDTSAEHLYMYEKKHLKEKSFQIKKNEGENLCGSSRGNP